MTRETTFWFLVGILFLLVAGIFGDYLFVVSQMNFSFRVFSLYVSSALMLIVAVVTGQQVGK